MTENMTEKKEFSLADFNLTKKCEDNVFEFEYVSDGQPTGFMLTICGSDAPRVQNWIRSELNKKRARDAIAQKRGKVVETSVEEDEQFGNEAAAMRIISWRGIKDEYSHEKAQWLMANNSEIREQVVAHSNNLANFMRG